MRAQLGQVARAARVFGEADLLEYRRLTGDTNPVHLDGAVARRAGFAAAVVPGMLLGGMISRLLGVELPGRGTNWMKQRLDFVGAAYAGEELTAAVEVVRVRPEKDLVNLRTTVHAGERLVAEGEALVMAREMVDRGG